MGNRILIVMNGYNWEGKQCTFFLVKGASTDFGRLIM